MNVVFTSEIFVANSTLRVLAAVGKRERTRLRRAHSFGCQKNEIRSASRSTSCISGSRLCVDCEQSWSTRPETHGPPEPIGPSRVAGQAVKSATPANALEHTLLYEITASNHQF
jgi:hypothetical protein